MIKLFSKRKKVKREKHYIPEDEILSLYEWSDQIHNLRKKDRAYSCINYCFWKNIEKIFPLLNIKNGRWAFCDDNPLRPYIYPR